MRPPLPFVAFALAAALALPAGTAAAEDPLADLPLPTPVPLPQLVGVPEGTLPNLSWLTLPPVSVPAVPLPNVTLPPVPNVTAPNLTIPGPLDVPRGEVRVAPFGCQAAAVRLPRHDAAVVLDGVPVVEVATPRVLICL